MTPEQRRRADDDSDADDLFGKLEELIERHQGRAARRRSEPAVPTLTEAVAPTRQQLEIPVLNEVVDPASGQPSDAAGALAEPVAPVIDQRKRLQVALYLRLRERLDQEIQAALAAHGLGPGTAVDQSLARVARELRNALPAIVREAVEQVFSAEQNEESGKL